MQGRVPGVHQETEEKQNYSLYYYKKRKNVQFDTKIIENGKRAAVRDIFLPKLAAIVKNGCVRQFWYLYPLVSNFHDI